MFGLFGSKESIRAAYDELFNYLADDWHMKDRYARAFLDEYRRSIAKFHKEATGRFEKIQNGDDPELRLMSTAMGGRDHALALTLVWQAYQGYMIDLRRGKHVGTNVELAIWAILSNRSELIGDFDKPFSRYIYEKHEERFPNLFDDVFEMNAED
jgi:hypothetical protein